MASKKGSTTCIDANADAEESLSADLQVAFEFICIAELVGLQTQYAKTIFIMLTLPESVAIDHQLCCVLAHIVTNLQHGPVAAAGPSFLAGVTFLTCAYHATVLRSYSLNTSRGYICK